MNNDQIKHIRDCATARDMWIALKNIHKRSSFGSILFVTRKLYNTKFSDGTMKAHIDKMLQMVSELQAVGETLKLRIIIAALLTSLPMDKYDGLVTSIEGDSDANQSVEHVINRMMDK